MFIIDCELWWLINIRTLGFVFSLCRVILVFFSHQLIGSQIQTNQFQSFEANYYRSHDWSHSANEHAFDIPYTFQSLNRFNQMICASHFDFLILYAHSSWWGGQKQLEAVQWDFQLICVEFFFSIFICLLNHFTPWMKLSNDYAAFPPNEIFGHSAFGLKQKMHTPIVISWRWFRRLRKKSNWIISSILFFSFSLPNLSTAWNLIIEKKN